jgi:NADPH:quinone reductase-like Zn-dependent oxidoreductase
VIREGAGRPVLKSTPIPELRDNYILVRTVAVALNPTDWTALDLAGDDGTIVDCNYAGIIEEVGKGVKKRFKRGDRVTAMAVEVIELSSFLATL